MKDCTCHVNDTTCRVHHMTETEARIRDLETEVERLREERDELNNGCRYWAKKYYRRKAEDWDDIDELKERIEMILPSLEGAAHADHVERANACARKALRIIAKLKEVE